jgi:predicted AlkP superfamily pyrophosphatase or phosphodiesterase
MSRAAILNVVGLTARHISAETTPNILAWLKHKQIAPIRPVLPAVTTTMQSTFLTGRRVSDHGIVANGWYNREQAEVQMWKQSNHLVKGEKFWDVLKREYPGYTVAKLFWWYNMYSTADYTITPRPAYPADGRKVFDIYTHPADLRERIKADLGDFPFPSFWGPMAGLPSSEWIAESAKWTEDKYWPNLSLVYLPHLDYNLQRLGPDDPAIVEDLRAIDRIVGDLIQFYKHRAIRVILLSEYGITPVSQAVHLNRVLREHGWIAIREELGLELLDCGASKAFAMADHQVAHIYVKDPAILPQVREVLAAVPGVESVIDGVWKASIGLDHPRSGDLICLADKDSWFTYYYWLDDALAPDFARCVDIHRKPGYDPVELFIDPTLKHPKFEVGKRLLMKKAGMRYLMDVIPLDATLVKGSHGRVPEDRYDWPILAGDFPHLMGDDSIPATKVFHEIIAAVKRGIADPPEAG